MSSDEKPPVDGVDPETGLPKPRVLVADDEPAFRDILSHLVSKKMGCFVETVETGDAVLAALEKDTVDILVTDMVMPGIHGLELISTVHEMRPSVDIMVMTGHVDAFPYVDVIRSGAADIITKPHTSEEFQAKLMRIIKERELRERLLLAEQKYRSLFQLSMDGNLILNPLDFSIVDVNQAFTRLTGFEGEKVIGRCLTDLFDESEKERFEKGMQIFANGGQGILGDVSVSTVSGEAFFADISVTFIDSRSERIVLMTFRDVTEQKDEAQRLITAAHTDGLTGLANRSALTTRLDTTILRSAKLGNPMSLLFIDLDNFKSCNDTHGHQAGDVLLKSVGSIIKGSIRSGAGDQGFRYGGDEFAVALASTKPEDAVTVAERMQEMYRAAETYGTSMSIGIAEYKAGMTSTDLIAAADQAVYQAKALGKNAVFVHGN